MDAPAVVAALREIADLIDIEGSNPRQASAYRKAADALFESSAPFAAVLARPSQIPGIGSKIGQVIRTIAERGVEAALDLLDITLPRSAARLIRLPGVGPKTAHTLVFQHGICALSDLQVALAAGKLRGVAGLGPNRLARLARDVAVLLERQHALPIALAWPAVQAICDTLRQLPGVEVAAVTGDARRFCVLCPRLEVVVGASDLTALVSWCAQNGEVKPSQQSGMEVGQGRAGSLERSEQASAEGVSAPASDAAGAASVMDVRLNVGVDRVTLRVHCVAPDRFATKLMRTTGDATHQGVIEGLLSQAGYTWTASGIVDKKGRPVRPRSEAELYALVGLPYYPPEVREDRGLLCDPTRLIQRSDIRGDLHVHTNWSDGSLSVAEVVEAAERLGYEYIAITDHSQSLTVAGGLTPERLRQQWAEIESVQQRTSVRILRGIEVDILADGSLDLPDDVLSELDIVVASVHSAMHQSRATMTKRMLRAIRHPSVDIIGHATGRKIGIRAGYDVELTALLAEAAKSGVAMELNANPNRLDLSDVWLREAAAAGVQVPIDTDTHRAHEFDHMAYGIRMALRGWLTPQHVLNTLPLSALMARLHRRRSRRGPVTPSGHRPGSAQ